MSTFINFMIEANFVLVIFLGLYYALFRKETSFSLIRLTMLGGIVLSLVLPFIHITTESETVPIPSLNDAFFYLLPLVQISEDGSTTQALSDGKSFINIWNTFLFVYFAGAVFTAFRFAREVYLLNKLARQGIIQQQSWLEIIHLQMPMPAFSFFNRIFIGRLEGHSETEREHIIRHEMIHVYRCHSIDILLVNLLKVVFWFNPFLTIYKKIFVQLHEFEADARSVENHDVNRYCNLLARVALQSAGFKLANHFNNSLTLKRIEMMRTVKSKIRTWKLAASGLFIVFVMMIVACQDQVTEADIAGSEIPNEAKVRFETFQTRFPGKTFIVEYDKEAEHKLQQLEKQYGNAKHIELFTINLKGELRTFSMLQYDADDISVSNEVYSKVDEVPEFKGGFDALGEFISQNLQYPLTARQQGIEGTSYIEFIVETDGTVTNVKTLRGISGECDAEAERVVKSFPKWIPGKNAGQVVRTKFVIPISYKLQ
jgi:TonB family protein